MKRAGFKVRPEKGGWLRTTLYPISHKDEFHFGAIDMMMLMALVLGTVAIARLFIAH